MRYSQTRIYDSMQVLLPIAYSAYEIVKAVVLFPIYWYTEGLYVKAWGVLRELRECRQLFHLRILFRHLFTPLYGYTDWETRFVSVIARSGHFVVMTTLALAFVIVLIGEFLVYIAIPPFLLYNVLYQVGVIDLDLYGPFFDLFDV